MRTLALQNKNNDTISRIIPKTTIHTAGTIDITIPYAAEITGTANTLKKY